MSGTARTGGILTPRRIDGALTCCFVGHGAGRIVRTALACAALAGCCASTASAQGRTVSAAGFRDSVGVTTHPIYFDTPYGQWDTVVARIRELGVAHMRSGVYSSNSAGWNARHWGDLNALVSAGIRLHLIVNRNCSDAQRMDPCLDVVRSQLPPGSVDFLEWDDEADYGGATSWAPRLAAWGRELYAKVKADPLLASIPVVGPALTRFGSPAMLGDQSAFLDWASIHPYTGARSPDPALVQNEREHIRPVSSAKPALATEAGFHTSPQAMRPGQPPTDEATAAVYTVRTVLEHYLSGIPRTYVYELVDELDDPARPEANFGLLRHDFSRKPAFTALKNLLAMAGVAGPATVTPLRFRVTGDTDDLRELALQQADRTYLLVLWRTASVWDRDERRPLSVAPRSFSVEVPGAISLARGNPLAGPGLTAGTVSDGRFTQSVGAHPVVLRLGIAPGGQPPLSGVAGGGGPAGGPGGANDRTRPRIRQVKIKKIARRRWAVYFRLSEPATVATRLDRGRKGSKRYRLLKRVAAKRMVKITGRRRISVGYLKVGRHRVLLSARDGAGNRTNVLVAFKIRAARRR
jgi:hypothetical protein